MIRIYTRKEKKDFSLKHLRRFLKKYFTSGANCDDLFLFFTSVGEREKKRKSFEDAYHLSAVEKEKKCRVKYLF